MIVLAHGFSYYQDLKAKNHFMSKDYMSNLC